MSGNRFITFMLAIALLKVAPLSAFGHEGHDHAPGEEGIAAAGPVTISEEAKANLGITVADVQLGTLEKTVTAFGRIVGIPSKQAAVSSRIPGRVTALLTNPGDHVDQGQDVVEVESLLSGNPPPKVRFTSPISGTVLHSEVVLGDSVEPNAHLMQIANLDEVYAEAKLFEGQLSTVAVGQDVRVRVHAFPDEIFAGKIELLSGELDPQTLTLKAWVRLANPDGKLRPNMQARLDVVTAVGDNVIVVPRSAVIGSSGNLSIYVEQSEATIPTYEKRLVVTGMEDDRFIEIIEGAIPDEKVVTVGNYQLQFVVSAKPAKAEDAAHADDGHSHGDAAEGSASPTPNSGQSLLTWMIGALVVVILAHLIFSIMSGRRAPSKAI